MQKKLLTKSNLKKIPEAPGVYIFWAKKKPLYIGKSLNLRRRVESYLSGPLAPKTARMIGTAKYFSIIKVGSELEALLLEAKLVRTEQPKYNSQLKDDKHPLYIKITREKYPRVLTARKLEDYGDAISFFGPFPSSTSVKSVLRLLRRVTPFSQHKIGKRPCLYSQIGLCNPCPSFIEGLKDETLKKALARRYRKNIHMIELVLSGKVGFLRRQLVRQMLAFSKTEKFEEASSLREQIRKLDYVTQPVTPVSYFLDNPNLLEDIRAKELKDLSKLIGDYVPAENLRRIECYDVSHLAGVAPTASMITLIMGEPEKNLYRNFRINSDKIADDISSMKEVARRREKNLSSWGVPDLIIVDGGKAQAKVFSEIFSKHSIPVIGLAKRFETVVIPQPAGSFSQIRTGPGGALNILKRARDEAHRFARRYHKKLFTKKLFNAN